MMKKTILKIVAAMAEKSIAKSNNTACNFLSSRKPLPISRTLRSKSLF